MSERAVHTVTLHPARALAGEVTVPGDKSISHRALILGALAHGKCVIENLSSGGDVASTWKCLAALGVTIEKAHDVVVVEGSGGYLPREPLEVLDAENSGTTMRMLTGLLAAQPFFSVITGDASLRRRPMSRVVTPLRSMGATIWGREGGRFAPLAIQGGKLRPIHYQSPVASAQVKSSIMLAGLFTDGEVTVEEPLPSRDHTERLLKYFGANVSWNDTAVRLTPGRTLQARDIHVPGDPSSAAFFIVATLITEHSEVVIRNVGINPRRIGFVHILKRMGARIEWTNLRVINEEPMADLIVRSSQLHGTEVEPEEVPSAIDELPIICIAAACAQGRTRISGAKELRVKESDRIAAMAAALSEMGVAHREYEDGIEICGRKRLKAFSGESWGDHRIAMSLMVAALAADGASTVSDISCMTISFPGFLDTLRSIIV